MSEETVVTEVAAAPEAVNTNGADGLKGPRESSQSVDITKPSPQKADNTPPVTDKDKTDEGQTTDGKPAPKDEGKGQGQKPPAQPAAVGIDGQYAEMLKAQGIDPADVAKPEVLNKLLGNYHQMQAQFTRDKQAAAAQKALTEAQSVLPKPEVTAGDEPKLESPLEQFEAAWEFSLRPFLAAAGVQNMDELRAKDPEAAADYQRQYLLKRQTAWEENQEWKQTQAFKQAEQQKKEIQFQNDMAQAKSMAQANLAEAKKALPKLEESFKAHGIEDLLKHLEDHYTIPRDFLLSDKKWTEMLAKAAHAMDVVANMDDHDQEVRENYRKDREKQNAARLPRGAGGAETFAPKEKPKIMDTSTRGVSF